MKGWRVWVTLAVLSATGLAGMTGRLRLETDIFSLLPKELPSVRGLILHQEHFGGTQELWLTLQCEDPDRLAEIAERIATEWLQDTNRVASVLWQEPWETSPEDLVEITAWGWLNRHPSEVDALVARLSDATLEQDLEATRRLLTTSLSPVDLVQRAQDPLGLILDLRSLGSGSVEPPQTEQPRTPENAEAPARSSGFVSNDGQFRLIRILPAIPLKDYRKAAEWLSAVQSQTQRVLNSNLQSDDPPVDLGWTGGPMFQVEIATGMERDLKLSVLITLGCVLILFGWVHRSWRPLFRLLRILLLTLVATLSVGCLLLGGINVISLGFAALLLGLVVDYGLILYQERRVHPERSGPELRRMLAPSIGGAAGTTALAFLLLNASGLPGLATLGTLVALGVLFGSLLMLAEFTSAHAEDSLHPISGIAARFHPNSQASNTIPSRTAWAGVVSLCLCVGIVAVLSGAGIPELDTGSEPLRPRFSAAHDELEKVQQRFGWGEDAVWLMGEASSARALTERWERVKSHLGDLQAEGRIRGYQALEGLWPQPDWHQANISKLKHLGEDWDRVEAAAARAGFRSEGLQFTKNLFASWARWNPQDLNIDNGHPLPQNATLDWITSEVLVRQPERWIVLARLLTIDAAPQMADAEFSKLESKLAVEEFWLTGWSRLGGGLAERLRTRLPLLVVSLALTLGLCLAWIFRRWKEWLLSATAMGVSAGLLLAGMRSLGVNWNLMNLMAIPLWMGVTVDISIHVLCALRRCQGAGPVFWRSTGRAVLLCGLASLAAFGSLAGSHNAGLASLNLVCGLGLASSLFVGLCLLPAWWHFGTGPSEVSEVSEVSNHGPQTQTVSSLYQSRFWCVGLGLVRRLPRGITCFLGWALGTFYGWMRSDRREIVVRNIEPWCSRSLNPRRCARRLFGEFGIKIADLWRYEAGANLEGWVVPGEGWDQWRTVRASGRGVLLVTIHLGNWELGAPLLQQQGESLLVLSAEEPDPALTRVRQEARARRGVETLVIGEDPFAFVTVIQRLQAGHVVALLLDRPMGGNTMTLQMSAGRDGREPQRVIKLSLAAAELARATNCLVVPVWVVRVANRYEARLKPPVAYTRENLNTRLGREQWTASLFKAFEEPLKAHPDQWFHFVPIWE